MRPLSVSKMNDEELQNYINSVQQFTQGAEAAKIRICECCIKVSSV